MQRSAAALTLYDPQTIMGRTTRAARQSGKGHREHHRVWPSVFGKKDPVSPAKDQEVKSWNQSSEITGACINRVGRQRG
jgi:hypothetical protein